MSNIGQYSNNIDYEYCIDSLKKCIKNCPKSYLSNTVESIIEALIDDIQKYGDGHKLIDMCKKKEYTYFQLEKRKWSVRNSHNIAWKLIAFDIGNNDTIYDIDSHSLTTLTEIFRKKGKYLRNCEFNDDILIITDIEPVTAPIIESNEKKNIVRNNNIDTVDYKINTLSIEEKRSLKISKLKRDTNYGSYIPTFITVDQSNKHIYNNMKIISDLILKHCSDRFYLKYLFKISIIPAYAEVFLKNKDQFNHIHSLSLKNIHIENLILYIFSYSIYILSKEEQLFGKNIQMNTRTIWKYSEFSHLKNITHPSRISSTFIPNLFLPDYKNNNIESNLFNYLQGKRYFNEEKEVYRRMKIISCGGLSNIDLKKFNACFTGSALVACLGYNPLEKNCNSFEEYINTYYSNADIDISIHVPVMSEFNSYAIDLMECILNKLDPEFCDINSYYKKIHLKYGKYKYKLYIEHKTNKNRSVQYDIFAILKKTPVQLVRSFHLPIVRAWWDGDDFHALTSCVCAYLSGVNINYKWTFSTTTPIDIYIKYLKRGYTTVLNESESKVVRKYIEKKELKIPYIRGSISRFNSFFYKGINVDNDPIVLNNASITNKVYGKLLYPNLSVLEKALSILPKKISFIKNIE